MKKVIFEVIVIFFIMSVNAGAQRFEFNTVIDKIIKDYGEFDGSGGAVYISFGKMDGSDALLAVCFEGKELKIMVFGNADGIQVTDELSFPLGGKNKYELYQGVIGDSMGVVLVTNNIEETFIIVNDTFVKINNKAEKKIKIAEFKNNKFKAVRKSDIYDIKKELQDEMIFNSKYKNSVNKIKIEEKQEIIKLLQACSEMVAFDSKNYNEDRFMIYILATHKNFRNIFGIPETEYFGKKDIGNCRISYVEKEYIDNIAQNVFGVQTKAGDVSKLIDIGYCQSGDLYYYKEPFTNKTYTFINDIKAAYDLGGGVKYIVFSDIYFDKTGVRDEYGYAVIKDNKRILKLEIGNNLLNDREIAEFAPISITNNFFYSNLPVNNYSNTNITTKIIVGAVIIYLSLMKAIYPF